MAKVFFPVRTITVPASKPHPPNTTYEVSFGHEHWGDGEMARVYKVQIAYDGHISGRKTPSYPEGTDDAERVLRAISELKKGEGDIGRGKVLPSGGEIHEQHPIKGDTNE